MSINAQQSRHRHIKSYLLAWKFLDWCCENALSPMKDVAMSPGGLGLLVTDINGKNCNTLPKIAGDITKTTNSLELGFLLFNVIQVNSAAKLGFSE